MPTLIFVIAAIIVFAGALVLFLRRPKAPADGAGLRDPEQSVEDTGEAVADALKGATPYVPEAMRDSPVNAGGLRATEAPAQPPADHKT